MWNLLRIIIFPLLSLYCLILLFYHTRHARHRLDLFAVSARYHGHDQFSLAAGAVRELTGMTLLQRRATGCPSPSVSDTFH